MGKSGSKIQSGELLITYQVEKYMRYLRRVANAPRRATRQMFRNANRAIEGAAELTSSLNESLPEMRQAAQNVIHIAESAQLTLEGISATTSAATDALSKANEVSGAIQDAIPDVRVAAQKVVEIAETAKTTLDGLGNATKTANEILLQMQTALAPVKLVWRTTDLTPTLLKIGAVLVNLKFAGAGCKFASLFFNIAREFGSEVVTVIKNYLFNRETMNEGEVARRAKRQGLNLDDLSVFAQVQNWMANHMTVTVTGLSVALFAMFQCTLGLPVRNMNTQAMLKFFGERSRHLKSMVDFVRGSWNIFTDVAEWIIEQVFPGMIKHELDNYIIGYTEWSKEVISLVDPKNPVNERVKKDKKLVFRISALYKRGLKYSANLSTLKINDDLRDHFQKCFRLCEGFLREADHSGALGNQPRVKPYIIQLFGESGVGKSGMLWPLCSDLNAALCKTEEEAKDIASEVYFRNAEQEFWDAYAGQNICVWDDFGQLTETSANPNPEFFEIIRAGNSAPYPLHMATLEEKAKTKFISKFCILTSNKINQKVSSLTFPSAMRRRIDCLCSVEIKPEFAMSGTNLDTGETVTRLDPSKCAGVANTDVYVFTLHDPETQQPLYDGDTEKTRKMNYEELVEFILKQSSLNFGASIDFNNSITERMNSERFNKMRSLLSCKATRQAIQESEFDGLDRYFEKLEEDQMALVCDLKAKPIQLGWLKDWKRKAQEWFSLKSVLITIGAILSGFGVLGAYTLWNKSKQEESDDTLPMPIPEGFSSGDNKTKYTKVLRAEASVSSDNITKYAKKIRAEGIDPDVSMSKTISRLLRHQMISEDGWIEVEELLRILKDKGLTRSKLINICQSDEIGNGGKGRFQMDKKNDKIRATQGHSFPIDPRKMYEPYTGQFASHFTYSTRVEMIADEGLKKMNRAFVHLHPGHISTPPVPLPNRSDVVWVDLTGLQAWLTPNGYVLVEFVPRENIVSFGKIGKLEREASVSGDNRTKYLPHVRTECDSEATLQAWKDKSAQELITHRVLGNLYRISIDGQERLNGLFVRDTCMLTVEHLSPWLRKGKEITISNMYGSTFTVPIRDLKCVPIKDSLGNSKDAMLIQFPRHVNCHSDIIKHFQKEPELSSRRADVCVPCIRSLNESRLFTILGNASCKIEHARVIFEDDVEVMIRDSLQYNLNTTNGDCGSPVIVNDTSFIRKIAGIHIAAYDDGSSAIGQSVTQNDILKHLHDLRPIVVDHDDLPNVGLKKACLQIRTEYSTDQIQELLDMPAETFGYIGQCEKIASPPAKTDLRPSKIYGYIEPTTKPAILRHPTVNMVHRNMEKCAINCPYIPQEEIDRAVGEVKALLISGESRTRLARVLTYEEAVAGSDISDYVDGIKRQSSPGYPHTFNKKPECPGKTTWFGKDEWVFSEEIRELVNTRIAWASEGKRYPTVWSDTLKDERRPIEKVNALKTRVFAHGPMDYTIAFRMYFLGFIAHIMENRIANEQSLGTNPFGMDWLLTSKKLSKFGKRVFAGDFSQFDGTLNACIMKEFAAVANTFYNDGPVNALIREVLMLEIYNSIHLCSGKFIQLTHSQPSGNPLTTVLNSFYNSVSMRIAYYRCFAGKAPPFLDNVSMVSYGDDNVINFSEKVEKEFNQNTVTEAYASFGMIYTDETKTMGEMAPWRLLSEVNYLKRMFRLEDGVWRAPLALETILESCNWVRKCPDELEACVSNCETAFRELAQHPEPVFKKYVEIIANALYEQTGQYPVIQPRLVYLEDDSPCW